MNYTTVRSHRRTMAIQIKRDGRVVVRAPYAATDEEVRQLVEKHRGWIEKSLARQREAPAASPPELTEQEMEELRRRGQEILPGSIGRHGWMFYPRGYGSPPHGPAGAAAPEKTACAFPCS